MSHQNKCDIILMIKTILTTNLVDPSPHIDVKNFEFQYYVSYISFILELLIIYLFLFKLLLIIFDVVR